MLARRYVVKRLEDLLYELSLAPPPPSGSAAGASGSGSASGSASASASASGGPLIDLDALQALWWTELLTSYSAHDHASAQLDK